MYDNYINYIKSIVNSDIKELRFKSNPLYCGILEHISENQGYEYLFEIKNRFELIYNKNINDLHLCTFKTPINTALYLYNIFI